MAKLKYETKACGRCGGSGHYSYCSMYGTTCFKCRGAKTVLTARGAKASAAVTEFIKTHFSVRVEDLKVGDRVRLEGRYTRTVTEIDGPRVSGWSTNPDGSKREYIGYTLSFDKPVPSMLGPCNSWGKHAGDTLLRPVAGADWDRVVEFARTLKGVTVEEAVTA